VRAEREGMDRVDLVDVVDHMDKNGRGERCGQSGLFLIPRSEYPALGLG
jgi:hypothetical protein